MFLVSLSRESRSANLNKMLDALDIFKLYENVLKSDMTQYNISTQAIKFGIECMAHVYGETVGLKSDRSQVADYTDPAHRCAYLHKYAALHTAMVRDMLFEAINENFNFFHKLIFSGELFKLCSLGGGPGTDIIGAMAALHASFAYFDAAVTVVDYMAEWQYSFASILQELGTGWYGAFGNNLSYYLNWQYVGANLLKSFKPDVIEALSSAKLVTMIKFASAAACKDTYCMIQNIFTAMRPGAALLFIDNDGGGFHKLILDAAIEFNFISIFGPLRRESYSNEFFRKKRFGYNSCCKTTVTVHILQKPFIYNNPYNSFPGAYANSYCLRSAKPSLLGSPPTPYLYRGTSPQENLNFLPAAASPLYLNENANQRLGYATAEEIKHGYSHDEDFGRIPGFVSPANQEIPQSPSPCSVPSCIITPTTSRIINSPIYTPECQTKRKRAHAQGCFPLRIQNFRHHISRKVQKVKARAKVIFKKKSKKFSPNNTHPIFRI